MSATTKTPTLPLRSVSVLVAPLGQLSGDGQLRELIEERRQRMGREVDLWYLGPELVEELHLAQSIRLSPAKDQAQLRPQGSVEAVAAGDAAVITWLQLRFGGCTGTLAVPKTWMQERAMGIPAAPPAPLHPSACRRTDP